METYVLPSLGKISKVGSNNQNDEELAIKGKNKLELQMEHERVILRRQ